MGERGLRAHQMDMTDPRRTHLPVFGSTTPPDRWGSKNHHMRSIPLLLALLLSCTASAQLAQTIDEQLLTEIITNKQEEVKARVLGNLISKNIHTTNYTTYNALYNLVDIILTEKNTTVMTDGIIHQVADYAITYALVDGFVRSNQAALPPPINAAGAGYDAAMKAAIGVASKPGQINLTDFRADGALDLNEVPNLPVLVLNWLTDTLWGSLAASPLAKYGLFEVDPRHPRVRLGLDKVDYEEFYRTNKPLADALSAKVIAYVNGLNDLVNDAAAAAQAIGSAHAADLAGLNIEKLSALTGKQVDALFSLWTRSVDLFRNTIHQNAIVGQIADLIGRYVITDMQQVDNGVNGTYKFQFSIDVEGIILDMEDEFTKVRVSSLRNSWIGVKPFFTIGLNYGYFGNFANSGLETQSQYNIESIGWAGEKVGLKFLLWDFGYTHSFRPGQWFKYRNGYRKWTSPPNKPLLYNIYLFTYASGLIYTIADLRTDATLNHAIIGTGGGFEFFNGMDFNLSYAVPMVPNTSFDTKLDNAFYNVGFDIPIFEYLKGKKKGTK